MLFEIKFQSNESFHNDLVLRIGSREWWCDTYYLAISNELNPESENELKVKTLLSYLLEQWLREIKKLRRDDCIFLPFEMADEGTAFLRCRHMGEVIELVTVVSDLGGWMISFQDISTYLHAVPSIYDESQAYLISKEDLIGGIERSLAALS